MGKVARELVRGDERLVLVPLGPLVPDQIVADVVAEGLAHEARLLELLDGLVEVFGQRVDAGLGPLGFGHLVDVVARLGRQGHALLDAVQTGGQHGGEGQVRVAGRVGVAEFDPGGVLLARLVERHPHHGRAVAARPADVDRSFVAGDQALVGVDPLVGDQGDLLDVGKQTGDVGLADRGEVVLVAGVEEGVPLALEQGLVDVHAGAVHAEHGLGHEGGVHAVSGGDLLDGRGGRS